MVYELKEELKNLETSSFFHTVLLVEDDPIHIKLLSRALDGLVGDIVVAKGGEEAIKLLVSSFPQLVFCDLNLPDISGFQVLDYIQSNFSTVPVVVMTSSNDLENAVFSMREGAWDYVVKDFSNSFRGKLSLVLRRIAERKLLQEREFRIRAERNAFWYASQHAFNGLGIITNEGSVIFSNETFRKFCSVLGAEIKEGENLQLVDLLTNTHPVIGRNLKKQLKSTSSNVFWTSEIEKELRDSKDEGDKYYFELTLTSISMVEGINSSLPLNKFGNLKRFVLWVRDITERKERERFQRDLLSTTTHDLKGPLGVILTSAELLLDPELKDNDNINFDDLILRIASSARNSITLIDELLSARRIQDGVLIVRPQELLVEEVLEDVVLDFYPVAKSKNIILESLVNDRDLTVYADRIGLNRVLNNLVSNAIKFGGKDGKVTINALRVKDNVSIVVSDTGPGISIKERAQLFMRYERLKKHENVDGTGLGLFVTKNIVNAHGGKIDVISKLGEGSSFIISFPNKP